MVRRSAFTLIELLIVVAIIAILAAIAVPNFLEAQTRSKVSRVVSDMRTVGVALEAYCVEHHKYPPMVDDRGAYIDWDDRLKPLTSPIAFLTNYEIMADIFNTDVLDRWNQGEHYGTEPVFTYRDRISLSKHASFDALIEDIWGRGDSLLYNTVWQLISFGPDHTLDSNNAWSVNTLYDASNGTRSGGDIIRIGP